MAFKRSFLESLGLNDQQVSAVMDEHVAVTDALKADRDKYKAEAEKLPDVQKQLDEARGSEDWKKKYEEEHQSFEDFKQKTADDAKAAKVRAAYRALLIDEKIGEKRLDSIMKVTDFSGMNVGEDGKLENEKELRKKIGDEWEEFRTIVAEKGAKVENPPAVSSGKMTKAEILAIKDTSARQRAIAENLDLFGKG